VEGDIDIEDDIPLPSENNAPPLLDDHSSDEENADLSSLSSLSSLSVFEESGNEISDQEESRSSHNRSRKKKATRHGKSSKKHHHHHHHHHHHTAMAPTSIPPQTTTSPQISVEKTPALLPRKKLWMRDYLNKHVTEQQLVTKPISGKKNTTKVWY
jgi:G3E family GTPase